MKQNLYYFTIGILIIVFFYNCNPIPKEDAHPEVPLLADLLKDETKFKKLVGIENIFEIIFLQDDRILLIPNNSALNFKIIDTNNTVIFENNSNPLMPFYIDKQGNLYFNGEKYFYPDYKNFTKFNTLVVQDSLKAKSKELGEMSDSLKIAALDQYEINLLKPYGLKLCPFTVIHTERCKIFDIINQTLIVRQNDLRKIEFSKEKKDIPKFDDDVLIKWNNGRLPSPEYLSYYELNKIRFKCDDLVKPGTINLNGKSYLHASRIGVYQILF